MTRDTHRGAARVTVLVAVLALILLWTPWQPAPAHAYKDAQFLLLVVNEVTPQMVTTAADPTVTIAGTVTNVGDRPVSEVVVRLEHAGAVTTSNELRSSLHGPHDQYRPVGDFVTVADTLDRGQQRPFTLSYPLRGETGPSWDIEAPGVYPALVNVNGTPDYGEPARLDDARFLLPVLGLPPSPDPSLTAEVPPDITHPVGLTMLWPLADRPRLAPGLTGGPTPVRLLDDGLAQSLSRGGRLDGLLGSVEFATSPEVDPQGVLRNALCLAVDPDLLVTINGMAYGYEVLDSPDPSPGAAHPGTDQALAVAWLDRLRALAKHTCVTALPYAQASLHSVSVMNDAGISEMVTTGASDTVDQILGIESLRGVTVLTHGSLTLSGAGLLSGTGPATAISAAPQRDGDQIDIGPRRLSERLVAAPFEPSVGAALSAVGITATTPDYVPTTSRFALQHDSRTARLQDALGAMAWRALSPDEAARDQLLVPSATWNPSGDEAREVLSAAATLLHTHLAAPRPLPDVILGAGVTTATEAVDGEFLTPSPDTVDDWVSRDLGNEMRRLWALTAALSTDARTGLTGVQFTAPLRQDALRAVSRAVPADIRDDNALARLAAIRRAVDDLFNAVTVVNPGGSYTLATEHSPLPLVLRNELPVPIRVALHVATPAGMRAGDVGVQELPPGYLPVKVPVEVNVSQRMAVDVTLHTPDGLPLGEPVRLSIHSNAYGKPLFIITVSAATVLFALTGRRLWHRFRGQPDRADLDRDDESWQP